MSDNILDFSAGQRFPDDDQRRAVLLERARPEIPPADRIQQLEAQLHAITLDYQSYQRTLAELSEIALWLREHCRDEIRRGEPQHSSTAATAVLYYAQRDRDRERRRRALPAWRRWLADMLE